MKGKGNAPLLKQKKKPFRNKFTKKKIPKAIIKSFTAQNLLYLQNIHVKFYRYWTKIEGFTAPRSGPKKGAEKMSLQLLRANKMKKMNGVKYKGTCFAHDYKKSSFLYSSVKKKIRLTLSILYLFFGNFNNKFN